jgi:hypothetical protein
MGSLNKTTDISNTPVTFVTISPSPSEMFSAGISSGLGIALWSFCIFDKRDRGCSEAHQDISAGIASFAIQKGCKTKKTTS